MNSTKFWNFNDEFQRYELKDSEEAAGYVMTLSVLFIEDMMHHFEREAKSKIVDVLVATLNKSDITTENKTLIIDDILAELKKNGIK